MDIRGTVPPRIDAHGSNVEDWREPASKTLREAEKTSCSFARNGSNLHVHVESCAVIAAGISGTPGRST